jgi:hypothetical protein
LGHADRVGGGAGSGVLKSECGYGVVHVGLVVGTVEVDAVPAAGVCVSVLGIGWGKGEGLTRGSGGLRRFRLCIALWGNLASPRLGQGVYSSSCNSSPYAA